MKKHVSLLLVILMVSILLGCDLIEQASLEEVLGEWDFPDGSHASLMSDNLTDAGIDIGWNEDANTSYFTFGNGTVSGNIYAGTYEYTLTVNNEQTQNQADLAITITFNVSNDTLSLSCEGEGPLDGKSFSGGVLQE